MNRDLTLPCADGLVNLRVGAILRKGGRFLMVRNAREDYFYSVGGRIQFGETAEDAVVREAEEETGWRLEVDRLGFVHEACFLCDTPGENLGKLVYEVAFYFYMKTPEDFEPVRKRLVEGGAEEFLEWVAPGEPRAIYPAFFREELRHPAGTVKHIVTDEREEGAKA